MQCHPPDVLNPFCAGPHETEQACTAPSSVNGGGDCPTQIPVTWFEEDNTYIVEAVVTVKYDGVVAASSDVQVSDLQGYVTPRDVTTVPGNAHLYFQLPLTPVYAGDSFSTQLYANTDGRAW